jgi:hypothetical protein
MPADRKAPTWPPGPGFFIKIRPKIFEDFLQFSCKKIGARARWQGSLVT